MQTEQNKRQDTHDHLFARFTVEPRGCLRERPDGGLTLDASRIDLGDANVALVLVADLIAVDGGRNDGLSATQAFPSIMSVYGETLLDTLGASDVLWIARDSLGYFDRVGIEAIHGELELTWQPLLSGMHLGRTEGDFVALFGEVAERAMRNVRAFRPLASDAS